MEISNRLDYALGVIDSLKQQILREKATFEKAYVEDEIEHSNNHYIRYLNWKLEEFTAKFIHVSSDIYNQ